MSRKNAIKEILQVKSRKEFNSREDLLLELGSLQSIVDQNSQDKNDQQNDSIKYVPIATVACFEAFFKSLLREIIDFGSPYVENASKFSQQNNIKLDIPHILEIQRKSFSLGELVAHFLPFSSLEAINGNISTLIEKDFLGELKIFSTKSKFDKAMIKSFQDAPAHVLQSVFRTFELRHIFCHEFSSNVQFSVNEIYFNLHNCILFLEVSNSYVQNLLYPDIPDTQQEMNIYAANEYEKIEAQLQDLIKKIKDIMPSSKYPFYDPSKLDDVFKKLEEYREVHAELTSSNSKGGTIYPLLYYTDMKNITQQFINNLTSEFEPILKKSNSH